MLLDYGNSSAGMRMDGKILEMLSDLHWHGNATRELQWHEESKDEGRAKNK